MSAPRAFILVGPTAVGKSAVAHEIARKDGHLILSADSMAVYRGMDIGTAKPTAEQRAEVDYAGVDLVDPTDDFSAGEFLRCVRDTLHEAQRQHRTILVVGGTGLYIRCLTEGLHATPAPPSGTRERLQALFEREGAPGLQAELRRTAPDRLAGLADPQNPRRLMRALELAAAGGAAASRAERARPALLGLMARSEVLRARIEARVRSMYEGGLLVEARALRDAGRPLSSTAAHAIGYAEAFGVLDGRMDVEEARQLTVQRSCQLAKRQMTWFRHQASMTWIDVAAARSLSETVAAVREHWTQHGSTALAI